MNTSRNNNNSSIRMNHSQQLNNSKLKKMNTVIRTSQDSKIPISDIGLEYKRSTSVPAKSKIQVQPDKASNKFDWKGLNLESNEF